MKLPDLQAIGQVLGDELGPMERRLRELEARTSAESVAELQRRVERLERLLEEFARVPNESV